MAARGGVRSADSDPAVPSHGPAGRVAGEGTSMTDVAVTSEKPPAPKQTRRGAGGVRGWFGRQPVWVRAVVVLAATAAAFLLPYVGDVPVIGPQIVTNGV